MLDQYLIEQIAEEAKIAPLHILREHIEMETLYYLSKSKLAERIIFYGGTALRLAYQGLRFSEDLDFLYVKGGTSDVALLKEILTQTAATNPGVTVEYVHEKRYTLFGVLHIKHPMLKHALRLKVEIAKRKNGIGALPRLLISPTTALQPILQTATLDGLARAKAYAISERNEVRDWFDLWYIEQKGIVIQKPHKPFPFPKAVFENELKRWLGRDNWRIIPSVILYYEKG